MKKVLTSLWIFAFITLSLLPYGCRRPVTFILNGQVIAEDGTPLGGSKVILVDRDLETETDERGKFTFTSLKPGRIKLRVEKEGFHPGEEEFNATGGNKVHLLILLIPIGREEAILRVKVRDEQTKAPLKGAVVTVGETVWYTDEGGLASIPINAGLHSVEVKAGGYKPYRLPGVEIFLGKVTNLEVDLTKEEPVPGTVGKLEIKIFDATTGRPVAGASIQVGEKIGQTNKEGYLLLEELPAQSLEVVITAPNYLLFREVVSIKADETLLLEVRLFGGLANRGGVAGIVRDKTTNIPLKGVAVEIKSTRLLTGDDGRFVFTNLEPGKITLSFNLKSYTPTMREITVEANRILQLEVHLERVPLEVTISGRVIDLRGQPVVRARLTSGSIQTLSDEEGKFRLIVKEDEKYLRIEKDGYYTEIRTLPSVTDVGQAFIDIILIKVVPDGVYKGNASSSQGSVELEVTVKENRLSGIRPMSYEGNAIFMDSFNDKLMEVANEILRLPPQEFFRRYSPYGEDVRQVLLSAIRSALIIP